MPSAQCTLRRFAPMGVADTLVHDRQFTVDWVVTAFGRLWIFETGKE